MRARAWVAGSVAAAVVVVSVFVAPVAAHADPVPDGPAPRVTSVDRSGAHPTIAIDWGVHANAPVGELEYVDGRTLGVAAAMTSVTDDAPSVAPRSYRAVACYDRCDADSIADGTATLVVGDWFRPDVAEHLGQSGPRVDASWSRRTFTVRPDTQDAPDAPAFVIFRDGTPVAVAAAPSYEVEDRGPFGDSVTYSVTACYSDCVLAAAASGFAQQTAGGPPTTIHAASPPTRTGADLRCRVPSFENRLEVGFDTVCSISVWTAEFSLVEPTGTATFTGDDDALLPPSSCTLVDGACDLTMTPAPGSAGPHEINLRYEGDADHRATDNRRIWNVALRPTTTLVTCDAASVEVAVPLGCTVSVADAEELVKAASAPTRRPSAG